MTKNDDNIWRTTVIYIPAAPVRSQPYTHTQIPAVIMAIAVEQEHVPDDSEQPLTVIVRHHVLRSKHDEFAKWCGDINLLVQKNDGFVSTEVIKPVCTDSSDEFNLACELNPSRESDEYITIVRFQSNAKLKQWMDSDARKGMLTRTDEFSKRESLYTYHSIEHWFPSIMHGTNPSGDVNAKKGGPPPKWKMCIFVTIVIYLQTLWIPKVTKRAIPKLTNTYWIGLINTFCIVVLVTYILFPICTRLVGFWLFPNEKYFDKLYELVPQRLKKTRTSNALPTNK
jgi:uncharacterized protein